jgi:multiple sugar transport system permease protein
MSTQTALPTVDVEPRRAPFRTTRTGIAVRVATAVAWVVVIVSATAPIVYLAIVSLSPRSDVLGGGVLPSRLAFENWPNAFRALDIPTFLGNSLIAAGVGAVLTLFIAIPGAYAMARHELLGGRLAGLVVGTYIAPPVLAVFPLFFLMRSIGLTNSAVGLGIVYGLANVPVAVWLLEGFVRRVPLEIEEAARVDGAGVLRTLRQVVLPLMAPGIAATGILCFILGYNEFLLARFFSTSTGSQTMTIAISLFQGDRQVQFGQMAAASLAALVPIYVLAVFFQRWLIDGLTHGSGK